MNKHADGAASSETGDRSGVIAENSKRPIAMLLIATTVIVALATSFVLATDIILILFLGVLFGIFLHRTSKMITWFTPISQGWSLAAVTTLFLLLLGAGIALFGIQIQTQISKAGKHMDAGVAKMRELADKYPTVNSAFQSTPFLKDFAASESMRSSAEVEDGASDDQAGSDSSQTETPHGNETQDDSAVEPKGNDTNTNGDSKRSKSNSSSKPSTGGSSIKSVMSRAVDVIGALFSTTLGLVVNSLLIFFVGLFLATSPKTYRDGCAQLMPPAKRDRTKEIMDEMGDAMWKWLLGRFGSMLITGIGAAIILSVLGVPMAISLGIATGLLAFIPNIGGSIAFIFAFLVALSQGVSTAVWLIPAYLALQLIESYVVTPLIQQKQVSIPPALLIAFQAIAGILFGFIGAAIASPLLAALKVGVQEAYINDVLENES